AAHPIWGLPFPESGCILNAARSEGYSQNPAACPINPCKGAPAGEPATSQKGHLMAAIFYHLSMLKARFAEADKERGATAVEYALLIAVVSIGLIVALDALNLTTIIARIQTYLNNAVVTT